MCIPCHTISQTLEMYSMLLFCFYSVWFPVDTYCFWITLAQQTWLHEVKMWLEGTHIVWAFSWAEETSMLETMAISLENLKHPEALCDIIDALRQLDTWRAILLQCLFYLICGTSWPSLFLRGPALNLVMPCFFLSIFKLLGCVRVSTGHFSILHCIA